MKKEIKNTTIYDRDSIKNFLKVFYFDKTRKVRIPVNIIIILIIIYFFTKNSHSTLDFITFFFCLFGILELNTSMLPNFNYLKLSKKKNSVIGTKNEYIFKKNNIKISTKKDEYIDYDKLYKVIETSDSYYLYVNSSRAYIVSKSSMKEEEITELTNIFKEKVSTYKFKK